jgi:hypothetical protein
MTTLNTATEIHRLTNILQKNVTTKVAKIVRKQSFNNNLTDKADQTSAKEFLELIGKAMSLLKTEQKTSKSFRVQGRIISLPASGIATIVGDLHGDLQIL